MNKLFVQGEKLIKKFGAVANIEYISKTKQVQPELIEFYKLQIRKFFILTKKTEDKYNLP